MPTPKERNLFKKEKQLGRLIVVLTQLSAPFAGNENLSSLPAKTSTPVEIGRIGSSSGGIFGLPLTFSSSPSLEVSLSPDSEVEGKLEDIGSREEANKNLATTSTADTVVVVDALVLSYKYDSNAICVTHRQRTMYVMINKKT